MISSISFRFAARCPVLLVAVLALVAACNHETLNTKPEPWLGGQVETPAPAAPVTAAPESPPPAPALEPARPVAAPPAPSAASDPVLDKIEPVSLTAPDAATREVRVGLLLPLSGERQALGRAFLEAAQQAVFDFGDERFVLLPRDTRGTPAGAAQAADAALAAGAELLLGPLFATSVEAAAPVAAARGVNLIAFSTDRSVARPGVYLIGYLPEAQVRRVVQFAIERGMRRFAAFAPRSPYGEAILATYRTVLGAEGGVLVESARYEGDGEDTHATVKVLARYDARRGALRAERRRLGAEKTPEAERALRALQGRETLGGVHFDAILIPDGGTSLRAVAPLLPYYDIDPGQVRFLGTGLWDDAKSHTEPALHGGWFAAPEPGPLAEFERRFKASYGRPPPRVASLAYDATALAAVLGRQSEAPDFSAEALTDPSGFGGSGGIFRFHADGLNSRGLAILEVTPTGVRVIDAAPASFAGSGF